jgi:hypothetical protein
MEAWKAAATNTCSLEPLGIDAIGDSETLGGIQYIPPWYFIPVYGTFK